MDIFRITILLTYVGLALQYTHNFIAINKFRTTPARISLSRIDAFAVEYKLVR